MATSDPGCGTVLSKVKSFKRLIEEKKSEVIRISKEMRSIVETNEETMIQKLDTNLDEFINKIDRKPDIDVPKMKLTWRVDELKDYINKICSCEVDSFMTYKENTRFQLKWSKCNRGSGDNQLSYPWGVAINPLNDRIYVADLANSRIQIFSSNGEWIRSISDNDKMPLPQNFLFFNKSTYVQCDRVILKFDQVTENTETYISYSFNIRGICTDNTKIYVGKHSGMILMSLTPDLNEKQMICLISEFSNEETQISDIAFSRNSFYVFLSETEFPIQVFSMTGTLTRCVVKKEYINKAYCFCLDPQLNILVADYGDCKVKIFSNEGKLITQFGEKGDEKGKFVHVLGITVDKCGTILTLDWKEFDILQLFFCDF